jgi:predicted nucleic acid-binding protein
VRIFLDANILFSAAASGSATRKLLKAAAQYSEVLTSPHTWEEARINIRKKRPDELKGLQELQKWIQISAAFKSDLKIKLPKQDVPVLAGAIGSQSTHLWTSDKKHFGKWYGKEVYGVMIVSSIILADILMKEGWNP